MSPGLVLRSLCQQETREGADSGFRNTDEHDRPPGETNTETETETETRKTQDSDWDSFLSWDWNALSQITDGPG